MLEQDTRLIDLQQRAACALPCLAGIIAIGLSLALGVSWDIGDCLTALLIAGLPVGLGLLLTRLGKVPAFSGILTIFGLTLSLMLIGAALALLGTRSPVAVAEPWLENRADGRGRLTRTSSTRQSRVRT